MTFGILKYLIGTKFRAHKRLFKALGTIVEKNLGTHQLAIKLEGHTALFHRRQFFC